MNEYESMKSELAKEFRNMGRGQAGPPVLDENGIDMMNSFYGKRHTEELKEERSNAMAGEGNYNWKGGISTGTIENRRKYHREWMRKKYGRSPQKRFALDAS